MRHADKSPAHHVPRARRHAPHSFGGARFPRPWSPLLSQLRFHSAFFTTTCKIRGGQNQSAKKGKARTSSSSSLSLSHTRCYMLNVFRLFAASNEPSFPDTSHFVRLNALFFLLRACPLSLAKERVLLHARSATCSVRRPSAVPIEIGSERTKGGREREVE